MSFETILSGFGSILMTECTKDLIYPQTAFSCPYSIFWWKKNLDIDGLLDLLEGLPNALNSSLNKLEPENTMKLLQDFVKINTKYKFFGPKMSVIS